MQHLLSGIIVALVLLLSDGLSLAGAGGSEASTANIEMPTKMPLRDPSVAPVLESRAPSAAPTFESKRYPDYSKNGFVGWVDPDTTESEKVVRSYVTGKEFKIVMSDEFNRDGRSFEDGADPMWTSMDKNDEDRGSGTLALEFYNSTNVWTEGGNLVIQTDAKKTQWRGVDPYLSTATKPKMMTFTRNFRSGMMQSWNKFCFTGGIFEVRVKMPGTSTNGGLWPAIWLLGNLGRATYEASNNLQWPWSFPTCSREHQHAQLISGCDTSVHYDLNPLQGRGATEIDVIETMAGEAGQLPIVQIPFERPYVSMTLQTAPGIPAKDNRPFPMTLPEWGFTWYQNLSYGANTSINPFFYGTDLASTSQFDPVYRSKAEAYQADAISSISALNKSFWSDFHTWRVEWQPGEDGHIQWFIDGEFKFGIPATSLDLMQSKIPQEPSSIVINTAISTSWGFPEAPDGCTEYDCSTTEGQCGFFPGFCSVLPAQFLIDYVHVFQDPTDSTQTVGCNPEGYPTTKFIEGNKKNYLRMLGNHIDNEPLKTVVTGGAACSSSRYCGNSTGECRGGYCSCVPGWMGPKCLVPAYCNNFTDWDENVILPPFDGPYIPFSLFCVIATFGLAFIISIYFVTTSRRKTMSENIS
jgi:beta-glucan synthesis-associated protein KRE6